MTGKTGVSGFGSETESDLPWLRAYPAKVAWDQRFTPRPVYAFLDDAAARLPKNPCTNFLGKVMSYGEIQAHVRHATAGFQRLGIGKGSKVGLFLPNSPTFLVAYYAVLRAGGTVVNFNPLYSIEELEHQVRDSGTTLMVTLDLKVLFNKVEALLERGLLERAVVASFPSLLPPVKSAMFRIAKSQELANVSSSPVRDKVIGQRDLMTNDGRFSPVDIAPEQDLAVLQYTGGTTGTPKGAMLTHANLSTNVEQVASWAGALEYGSERVMGILPFFHVFAMTVVMNFGVSRASEIILVPKFELNDTLKLINQVKPTLMPGVPTLFNAILNHRKIKSYDLSSLKFCLSGGAALPVEVKRGFETLTGCKLVEGYGLSETSPVVSANPPDGPVKDGSIGMPLPGTRLSIRSLEDPSKVLGLNEDGEICIAGPQVMPGYWNKPEETREAFAGDYFRTGDIGHMDEDGFVFIVDRLKDMINCSGFKVYPRRVEEALYEHAAVEEVVVIGIPNKHRGEAPKAFVKLREGMQATPQELMEHLRPKLSKIEMPEEIEIRNSLPKTMIGKLSKKELKAEEAAKAKSHS
ncbi:MAG: long-chain fatty acid--CoA ligase [Hyphomicrobiaceae bacterium]